MDVKKKLVELITKAKEIYAGDYTDHTEDEYIAEMLLDNGVTVQDGKDTDVPTEWIPASEPPTEYRDEYGELIPFLVCFEGSEYSFRAEYDGTVWRETLGPISVTHWMPMPKPPKGE